MALVVLIVLNIMSMLICYLVAKWRGGNTVRWLVLGALLGPIALPFLLFMKTNNTPNE